MQHATINSDGCVLLIGVEPIQARALSVKLKELYAFIVTHVFDDLQPGSMLPALQADTPHDYSRYRA